MMDEIKQIIEMIAKLPQLAVWVLVAFWAYKVVVIGSIYGVIRLAIVKAHSWLTTPKYELIKVRPMLDRITIGGTADDLIEQIKRCRRVTGAYIHDSDIAWLKSAIDAKLLSEGKER